jgi:hypothetical protein
MKPHQKIASVTALAFIGLFEIAERAEIVKSLLPKWLTAHSDLTVIALLIGTCLYLVFTHSEVGRQELSEPLHPPPNTSTGGTATATAEGGKIEQHFHLPNGITHPQSPSQAGSKHNVQCLGTTGITDPPQMLALCFENVLIPNEPVDEFKSARLKVVYFSHPSGEEILEVFPARWWGTREATVNLGTKKRCAEIASFDPSHGYISDRFNGWQAHQVIETKNDPNTLLILFLPLGAIKIVATLIGEGNLSIAPFTGILTLEKGGSATFEQTSG